MSLHRPFAATALAALALAAGSIAPAAAVERVMSAPPAVSTSPKIVSTQSALLVARDAPAMEIVLAAPTPAELAIVNPVARAGMLERQQVIGIGRTVPAELRTLRLDALTWTVAADGARVAHLRIKSVAAAALRLALVATPGDPDIVVRMQGSASGAAPMGPWPLNEIAAGSVGGAQWWSPVLEGDTATVEIAAAPGVRLGSTALTLQRVSHMVASGSQLAPGVPARATGPGTSDSCEVDWKCIAPTAALTNAAAAQARITFTHGDGSSYLCSATLVNDTSASQTPYVITANHCISDGDMAKSMNLYWFYDSIGCTSPDNINGSKIPQAYTVQTGGSTLLAGSVADDWTLVRLNKPVPAGVTFSAWNATPVVAGEAIDLHHPSGDLTKYSIGNLQGYEYFLVQDEDGNTDGNAEFLVVRWDPARGGIVEGGSSGSGLLTYNGGKGWYELRAMLSGSNVSCSSTVEPNAFARMDMAIPKIRDYLAPGTTQSNLAMVVEYYHPDLDHYFMTMDAGEIAALDSGAFQGWKRTGLRFLAYKTQVAGSSPVCRAYLQLPTTSTHFYSAVQAECDLLGTAPAFKDWVVETRSAFYIKTPDATGLCPTGTHSVWRFFHAEVTNHRFTDDLTIHDRLHDDSAWGAEGYGPDAVIMCSPDGA